MTMTYDSINYGAYIHNGKVEYYEEYSLNGCIVFTIGITYKDYWGALLKSGECH